MKILWIFNHPAPYKVDFFNELGKKADLTVLFERHKEDDREAAFYSSKASNFKSIFLKSIKLGPHNVYSPGITKHLTNEYDLIVVNGWSTLGEMKVIRYLKKKGIPYCFAINGGIAKNRKFSLREHLKRKYLPGASLYLSPDESSSDYLTHYGVDKEKIRLFPYSTIHADQVKKEPIPKAERMSFFESKGIKATSVYLSVGQLIKRKNPLQLLEYFSKTGRDKALVYLGSGPLEKEIKERARQLNMGNVYLTGFLNKKETLEWMANADATIFLTREDIYGHVVNESLSQGTPVIGNLNANASKKLIAEGKTGFFVDGEKNFIKALDLCLKEEHRRDAIEAAKNETLENMAQVHMDIFEEYLNA